MGIAAHIARMGLAAHPATAKDDCVEQPVIAFYEGLTGEEEQMIKSVFEQYNVKPNSRFKPWEFAKFPDKYITIRRFDDYDNAPEFRKDIHQVVGYLRMYYSDNSHREE